MAHGTVNVGFGNKTSLQGFFQIATIIIAAQVDIHTRFQSKSGCFGRVSGHMLGGIDGIDGIKIGENDAFEVPRIAQHLLKQPFIGRTRHTVDGVVGSHHGVGTAYANSLFKRRQIVRHQTILSNFRRGGIMTALRDTICGQVFQCSADIFLHSFDNGSTQCTREIRILSHRFFHPRPPWVTSNIEYGTIANLRTLQPHFSSHYLAHLFQEFRIPSGGLSDARGENRCAHGHMAMGCFFTEQ